jgi:Nucleotidyltransferase domain
MEPPADLARLGPAAAARLVAAFAEAVQPAADVTALYVGGSLAAGDYRPGVSDFDLVALVAAPLDDVRRHDVQAVHRGLLRAEPLVATLHCAYLPVREVDDVAAQHLSWSHGELWRRPVSGVARAELLRFGLTVFGPAPAALLPPVSYEALRTAVRGELSGYWSGAVRKPGLWWQDVYVDLGLVTLPRAAAALRDGSLITKRDALPRLRDFGVDPRLIEEMTRRRAGERVTLGPGARSRRAAHARTVVRRGITALLRL